MTPEWRRLAVVSTIVLASLMVAQETRAQEQTVSSRVREVLTAHCPAVRTVILRVADLLELFTENIQANTEWREWIRTNRAVITASVAATVTVVSYLRQSPIGQVVGLGILACVPFEMGLDRFEELVDEYVSTSAVRRPLLNP